MKDINKQIEFIDTKLLPLFGLENIKDYVNYIKCSFDDQTKEKEFIKKINDLLSDIKTLFPIKRFNLHKTDNKIMTYKQAVNILKMCLEIANINYTIDKLNDKSIMRLNTINLFLYKYIQTMNPTEKTSDLRQNNSVLSGILNNTPITPNTSIAQYLRPGTKEAHKIYTNYTTNDLRKQIKTAKTSHIMISLRHFISNIDGKKILEIPLNLIESLNISAIKFAENKSFDIKEYIFDKYYILSNRYGYMIDGEFEFYKNLIPNNIILPLNLSLWCDLKLYIPLNIDNEKIFDILTYEIYFEIEFVEPIFYKSFQEKLLSEKDCFLLQEFDNKILVYDFNQKDFIVQKDNKNYVVKEKEDINDNDSIIFMEDTKYNVNKIKIGDLNGYEFTYTPNYCKPNFIMALIIKKCNFIRSKFIYRTGLSGDKYTKTILFTEKISDNNFKHILNISFNTHFNTHFDTIGNINIIKNFKNFEKIKVECKFSGLNNVCIPITLKEKLYDKNDFITQNSKVMYFSELENKQINLLNKYDFTLRLVLESNESLNLFQYINFIYDIYYYDMPIRKKISKLENFIDQKSLNECVKY
jgi:hypothetical protein